MTTIGNGTATVIDVSHTLGTADVAPYVIDLATGEIEFPGVVIVDSSTVRFVFARAPAAASKKVVLLAAPAAPTSSFGSWAGSIGDGVTSGPFTINHGLGTRDFAVQAFLNVAPYDEVELDYERTSTTTLTCWTRGIVPPAGGVRVLISGPPGPVGLAVQHSPQHMPGGADQILSAEQDFVQNGVVNPTDLVPSTVAGGTQIGPGVLWARTPGGVMMRQVALGSTVVAHAANPGGNPRVDVVIATPSPNFNGSPTISVLQGTPTAGAQITGIQTPATYRAGAATTPAGAVVLRDVLIAAGAAANTISVAVDRRPWARGHDVTVQQTVANISCPTTGADLTGTQVRLECSGVPIRVHAMGYVFIGNVNDAVTAALSAYMDGGGISSVHQKLGSNSLGTNYGSVVVGCKVTPTPGSHVFKLVGADNANGGAATTPQFATSTLHITELVGGDTINGTV